MTNQITVPEIPYSREAEEALIGSLFINPDVYYEIASVLELVAEDFYIHRLRWAYEAFLRLQDKGTPFDLLTFGEEMNSHYAEFGGSAYTTSLLNQVPTSLNALSYAQIVKANSTRRKLLEAANGIAGEAYNTEKDIEEVTGKSVQLLDKAVRGDGQQSTERLSAVISRVYDAIEENSRLQGNEKDLGLKTGYPDLDALIGGIDDTDLILVGARPGMGKSAFLANVARLTAVENTKRIAFFSLEMSNDQTAHRFLGQLARIDTMQLKAGKIAETKYLQYISAIEQLESANIHLSENPAITPNRLRAVCSQLKMTEGLDLIVVDYIGLMGVTDAGQRFNNTTERISYISRQLKVLAQEIHVPVMAAVQLNRELEKRADKRPGLADLRSSGSLEQDANQVWFLYREGEYDDGVINPNLTEIIVAKHRGGPTGTVDLLYSPTFTRFDSTQTRTIKLN